MAKRKQAGDPPSPATRARVLMACAYGQPDDIVTLSDTELDQAVEFGMVDPEPDLFRIIRKISFLLPVRSIILRHWLSAAILLIAPRSLI